MLVLLQDRHPAPEQLMLSAAYQDPILLCSCCGTCVLGALLSDGLVHGESVVIPRAAAHSSAAQQLHTAAAQVKQS